MRRTPDSATDARGSPIRYNRPVFAGRPIIGIAGGIGSGKSFVASRFGELGCLVIDSDEQVRAAYRDPQIKQTLRDWWGPEIFTPEGEINRSALARLAFTDPARRQRLESLLHPWVKRARGEAMRAASNDAQVKAFVWDTPLLFETGLNRECDAVVFVDAPREQRLQRVRQTRGWDDAELTRRENLQLPLDTKREISDYVVKNTADAEDARVQVRELLPRILAGPSNRQNRPTGGTP